jgi:hypothetical protein
VANETYFEVSVHWDGVALVLIYSVW